MMRAGSGRPRQEDEMSDSETTPAGDEVELMEFETEGVDDDGNVVVDDVVVAVDADGNVLATDETVAVLTAQGDVVVEETVSIVGDDGRLHVLEEDVVVVEHDEEDES
jgi:hypothetical protein